MDFYALKALGADTRNPTKGLELFLKKEYI
jgi:hypothetical protein